jgi:hypothetical protein
VQHVAESVGDRGLKAARDERRDRAVAGLDLFGGRLDILDGFWRLNAALLEDVGAVIEDRAFDVHRHAGQLAAEGRGLQQGPAQPGRVVLLGDFVLGHRREIGVPAGGGELFALA